MALRRLIPASFRLGGLALAAAAAVGVGTSALRAEEEAGREDYQKALAELNQMLVESPSGVKRDFDLYELDIAAVAMKSIIIADRDGTGRRYQYLIFRLRNRTSEAADYLQQHATHYRQLLSDITKEFEDLGGEIKTSVDEAGGGKLTVDGVEALSPEDAKLKVVVERSELASRPRKVRIAALAYDENGTRMRLLDKVPGEGPQELFDFKDLGASTFSANLDLVRQTIEEKVKRRLWLPSELRDKELAPYNPAGEKDEFDQVPGEVYGVIVFDALTDQGDHFTVELHGLCNKLRFKDDLPARGTLGDYYADRVLRRTFVVEYDRPGDEYFRAEDDFVQTFTGWRWMPSFQRLQHRADRAYVRYWLENITLEKERKDPTQVEIDAGVDSQKGGRQTKTVTIDMPVLHDEAVSTDFWTYYKAVRETYRTAGLPDLETRLPDFESLLKEKPERQ